MPVLKLSTPPGAHHVSLQRSAGRQDVQAVLVLVLISPSSTRHSVDGSEGRKVAYPPIVERRVGPYLLCVYHISDKPYDKQRAEVGLRRLEGGFVLGSVFPCLEYVPCKTVRLSDAAL